MKRNVSRKNTDKKGRCIIIGIGVICIIISILLIPVFRNTIAGIALPDVSKRSYISYTVKTAEGQTVPVSVEYVTNNGKLFSFSHSLSSMMIAIVFFAIMKWIYKIVYRKGIHVDLSKFISWMGILVLFLGIFTFTSKINPNNNIDKYKIDFEESGYLAPTDYLSGDSQKIIGYIKNADIQSENKLIAVYKAPKVESAPIEKENKKDEISMYLIKNIETINIWAETLTIILGVYIVVLNDYQKRIENKG